MKNIETVVVTGGCGFIGTNFIRYLFEDIKFKGKIVNIDKLTYAGNPENLSDIASKYKDFYIFENEDICNIECMKEIFRHHNIDVLVNFAAESHVDRSIYGPQEFIHTNIIGTFSLLEAFREIHKDKRDILFQHISTDEVYGSLESTGYFSETTSYNPRSPYSASKASADHLVKSYYHTYDLPVIVSNCSNNYGPYQFPEKLVPLMIINMLEGKNLPIYGDGQQIRDWLFVKDHCSAIWEIINNGSIGESYNIGGDNEWSNLNLINLLCEVVADNMEVPSINYKKLITFIKDRPGHDRRYAVSSDKLRLELKWKPIMSFYEGLDFTVKWHLKNIDWLKRIKTGEYLNWIERHYANNYK